MGPSKSMLYVTGLVLAIVGPIVAFSGADMLGGVAKSWFAKKPAAHAPATPLEIARGDSAGDNRLLPANAATADRFPTPTLDEVLRFDVTVEWVMGRWPRVMTGTPYLQLQGYRVPLMTGTGTTDVAGSLTYYFNAGQQVDRITLRGTTGDPSQLVMLLASRYHFARRLTNDPAIVLFEAVDPVNKPVGTLKIRSAAVIKNSDPYSRFLIDLVIDRAQ
jgi:hypothetical protein